MVIVSYTKFFRGHAVIDANVIIDLSEIGGLSVLNRVFARIAIPEQVVQFELQTVDLTRISFAKLNITSSEGYRLFSQLGKRYLELSQYDRVTLAIACENRLICATNERPMRRVCKKYNIEVVGTLGVLGCAKQTDLISKKQLAHFVDLLELSSCYLSEKLLRGFRQQFGLATEAG